MRPSLGGLLLVLPEAPQQFDYGQMLKVAAALGAVACGDWLGAPVSPRGDALSSNVVFVEESTSRKERL